jgi:hypothetical protein
MVAAHHLSASLNRMSLLEVFFIARTISLDRRLKLGRLSLSATVLKATRSNNYERGHHKSLDIY